MRSEGIAAQASPVLHAHKSTVDGGSTDRTGDACRRTTIGVARADHWDRESELVMSHRDLMTLRALRFGGRVRDGLGGR